MKKYEVTFSDGKNRHWYIVKANTKDEAFNKSFKWLNEDFKVDGMPYFFIEEVYYQLKLSKV